jgi:hypothetical protein
MDRRGFTITERSEGFVDIEREVWRPHSTANWRNGPLKTNFTGKPSMSFGNGF